MKNTNPGPVEGLSHEQLLEKRDSLISQLRKARVPSVLSAGLGKRDGSRVLTVVVSGAVPKGIPENFEGVPVVVTSIKPAFAY